MIAVAPLPTGLFEVGADRRVAAEMRALLSGRTTTRLVGSGVEVPLVLDELLLPDLAVQPRASGITYYHRIAGKQEIYLIANSGPTVKNAAVTLRTVGTVTLWDHRTGRITPLPTRTAGGRTEVHLDFARGEAHLLVVEH